jgi:hypothetical protein
LGKSKSAGSFALKLEKHIKLPSFVEKKNVNPTQNMLQGACLPHCYTAAPGTVLLARFAFVYIVASIGYLLMTRNLGTPFKDSLTEEQLRIKATAVNIRKKAFTTSALMGLVIVVLWKPFSPTPT